MCHANDASAKADKAPSAPPKHIGGHAATRDSGVWISPYDPAVPRKTGLPTKGELKAVIPAHCFERSILRSFFYVFRDFFWVSLCVGFATRYLSCTEIPAIPMGMKDTDAIVALTVWVFGWSGYAIMVGTIGFGIWVLAHECNHGAFSDYPLLNDCVGYILHQALLVPYFAWQFSHGKHHRRNQHVSDAESHIPNLYLGVDSPLQIVYDILGDDCFAALEIFGHIVVGWQLYVLGVDSTGQGRWDTQGKPLEPGSVMDHFRPNSPMFPPKWRTRIVLSDIGCLAMLAALGTVMYKYGSLPVILYYWAPYTVMNMWLLLVTWLQHTDPSVPHYDSENWDYIKGALATIDRDYGILVDFLQHRIASTHVAHHLFHEMPWYHAQEATAHLRNFLEPQGLYNYDPTPIWKAMWRTAKTCHVVENEKGIVYYYNMGELKAKQLADKKD